MSGVSGVSVKVNTPVEVKKIDSTSTIPEIQNALPPAEAPKDKVSNSNLKVGAVPGVKIELYDVVKNPVAGGLIGVGGVGAVTAVARAAANPEGFKSILFSPKPHASATLSAGAIGIGIGILNLNTDGNAKATNIKYAVGGTTLATGSAGLVSSIARKIYTNDDAITTSVSSPAIIAYGGAIGLGMALSSMDAKDKNVRISKNALSGALIGTGVAGIAGSAIRTLAGGKLLTSPGTVVMLGAIAGAGIAIAATEK